MLVYCIAFGIVVFILFMCPPVRCCVAHPVSSMGYACSDLVERIQKHLGRLCPTGDLDVYCGYFGQGKTLSAVHRVVGIFRRYNGLTVWDARQRKFVQQRVLILSNVTLTVPYVELQSLAQVVAASKINQAYDDEHNTLTVTIVLMDELSVQMNSRDFKNNFNAYFLNTLLCCRHYHISFFGTSQRFAHCDKLLRDVTRNVIQCSKLWRFQTLRYYDAWDVENAQNPELVKPRQIRCWFVRNKDYAAYDTLAVVGNLEKDFANGKLASEQDILASQGANVANPDVVLNTSRRYRHNHKKTA